MSAMWSLPAGFLSSSCMMSQGWRKCFKWDKIVCCCVLVSPAVWHVGLKKVGVNTRLALTAWENNPVTLSSTVWTVRQRGQLAGWGWMYICVCVGIWVYMCVSLSLCVCVILRGRRSSCGSQRATLFPSQQEGRALSICCLHSHTHI